MSETSPWWIAAQSLQRGWISLVYLHWEDEPPWLSFHPAPHSFLFLLIYCCKLFLSSTFNTHLNNSSFPKLFLQMQREKNQAKTKN
jgi:hypothetical protein